MTFLRFQELRDIRRSDFQFQRRGHTVEPLDALAGQALGMLGQNNEAGSHYETGNINNAPSTERLGGYADNLPFAYAHVAYTIQAGPRIDDASTFQNQIVLLRRRDGRQHHD